MLVEDFKQMAFHMPQALQSAIDRIRPDIDSDSVDLLDVMVEEVSANCSRSLKLV